MNLWSLLPNIIMDGLSYAMVLFMISVGLAISLGLMHVVNMAHGAFAMLGGFGTIWLMNWMNLPFEAAAILAVLTAAIAGIGMERLLVRRMYKRSELDQALLTIGAAFVAMAVINMIFGANFRVLELPTWLAGTVDIGFRTVQIQRIAVILLGFTSMFLLWFFLERARVGISIRAAVDNAAIAETMGINTMRIYSLSFGLGAGLAALGGIAGAEMLPMEPTYALKYIVIFLAVVAVGGQGTILGAFLASLLLGMVETTAKYLVPDMSYIAFFVTMLIVLTLRPQGILGRTK